MQKGEKRKFNFDPFCFRNLQQTSGETIRRRRCLGSSPILRLGAGEDPYIHISIYPSIHISIYPYENTWKIHKSIFDVSIGKYPFVKFCSWSWCSRKCWAGTPRRWRPGSWPGCRKTTGLTTYLSICLFWELLHWKSRLTAGIPTRLGTNCQ